MKQSKEDNEFKFYHRKDYDISFIKNAVIDLEKEWFLDTTRQETFAAHKNTTSYILNRIDGHWEVNTPLIELVKADDKLMWDLVSPITSDLESLCDGVIGQVLLIKLSAGKDIEVHTDSGDYLHYVSRHHIPIITNPKVGFFIDGETQHMKEGECWEINNNKPHAVFNRGTQDRVHLLIDIMPNKYL